MSKMKSLKAAILLEKQYEDLELWYPYFRLKEEGVSASFISPEAEQKYPSKHGYMATSHQSIEQVSCENFNAVIIPGGFSPDFMRRNEKMKSFVREAVQKNLVVASICHGAWMLCQTDLIKGRQLTSYFSIKDDVVNAGAKWIDQEVVRDGNLISSRKPDDLPAFMKAVLGALSEI